MSMTVEQRLRALEDGQEIAKLKAAYCHYADGGWDGRLSHDYDRVVSLFTPDGVWDGGQFGKSVGRTAIRELFKSFQQKLPFAVHRVSNPVIEVNGDSGTGKWHIVADLIRAEDNQAVWMAGDYSDEFVRTPEGWKFKSLKFTAAFPEFRIRK